MSEALARLAAAHGIAPEYHDIWGNRHQVSDRTMAALLAAMGVHSRDDEVDAILRSGEDARDAQRIAPLVVLRENIRPWTLQLRLPAALATATLGVRVTTENGAPCDDAAIAIVWRDPPMHEGASIRLEVALTAAVSPGYHRVEFIAGTDVVARTCCAIAPAACYSPGPPEHERTWGAAAQLYAVRSTRNWGIGDFTDLATLIDQWGARGAGIVGLSPLHALFPAMPERMSPYSPSSRLFRNILYIDIEAVPELGECEAARTRVNSVPFRQRLAALRDATYVDYAGVASAKRGILELLYRHFRERYLAGSNPRAEAFHRYVIEGGVPLRRHAIFDALHEHFHRANPAVWGWPAWPEAYRDPDAPAVARFAAEHSEQVEFHAYLQWQAEQQLAAAGARARSAGLAVGVYTDLAVSIDRGGSEAWSNQPIYALGASVGAPPDAFNTSGQDWGLPPMIPGKLRDAGYAPFLATLRANMRHAGALRIDHVMALARLFWIPAGGTPGDGAYVHYPFDDLLGLVALESHRHRCLVVGEDLGTVPDAIRTALAANAVQSYRVLIFERDAAGEFSAPDAYPAEALATTSTHDTPTLAGWWTGADIELRAANGLSGADREIEQRTRHRDRAQLLAALDHAGLLPPAASSEPVALPAMDPALARAAQAYLAATPARLHVVALEDVLQVIDQPNLPGTTESHPNWQRKLPLALEDWPGDERFETLADVLSTARPRAPQRRAAGDRTTALHVPRATYRLQLNCAFTFAAATALVPYLASLGISHVYCSPYLQARPGSPHGYDIVDHGKLNPELGSRADFERFVAALAARGMGHICDVVPNHVGVMGGDNAWWMDMLESGPASAYADCFDIDWSPFDAELAGRVLVPVLGAPYGAVLERGELRLTFERERGAFAVGYFGHRFPIDPREFPRLLGPAFERARGALPPEAAAATERLLSTLRALPARSTAARDAVAARQRGCAAGKAELATLAARHRVLADAIADVVEEFNGVPGEPATFDALHALLQAQAFRLSYWRVASDEINYRRFFDVNDLAALRMENADVFEATHAFILELAAAGKIHGLRIDHPDGLHDPASYFARLQARYRQRVAQAEASPHPDIRPLYVVLEKISADGERVPMEWQVSGSTGYDFANLVNGLFVAGTARERLDQTWRSFVGAEALDYATAVRRSKRRVMRGPLAAELTMLTHRALRIARSDPRTRDFTFNVLHRAIEEVVARFPVYRTYVADAGASAQDYHYIDWAVVHAQRDSRTADASVFAFLRAMMLAAPPPGTTAEQAAEYRAFAMRFQQFTAPVAAKGIEDSVFYTFNRLVSLNDVGGDPERFGTSVQSFHDASRDRADAWPATMLATSTHDSKRSEDVRARIDVISEMPAAWQLLVRRWSRANRGRKRQVLDREAPSRTDEYLLYQTLVGTLPTGEWSDDALARYRERIQRYMVKAAREANVRTSWLEVNADYEEALAAFVGALLEAGDNRFLANLRRQGTGFAWFGLLNSLSMALIKFASPGVPDLYQGNEMLALQLVDPDNRTPVDYDARRTQLATLEALAGGPASALADAIPSWFIGSGDGASAKLWLTYRLLRYRAAYPATMAHGDYLPVYASGMRAQHVVAFARRYGEGCAIAVAGRLFASLGPAPGILPLGEAAWGDTTLDVGFLPRDTTVVNVLTRETLPVRAERLALADVFRLFPGALLHCVPSVRS